MAFLFCEFDPLIGSHHKTRQFNDEKNSFVSGQIHYSYVPYITLVLSFSMPTNERLNIFAPDVYLQCCMAAEQFYKFVVRRFDAPVRTRRCGTAHNNRLCWSDKILSRFEPSGAETEFRAVKCLFQTKPIVALPAFKSYRRKCQWREVNVCIQSTTAAWQITRHARKQKQARISFIARESKWNKCNGNAVMSPVAIHVISNTKTIQIRRLCIL